VSTLLQSTDWQSDFSVEAADVLRQLRNAITGMFDSTRGGVRKSRDVQKLLGVDTRLSWQIFKLAGPGDALSLAPHVPSSSSMKRLLDAARERGISQQRVEHVRDAYEKFERLVETHAGDRTSFQSMARGRNEDDETAQTDIRHRKARFQADRHYAGAEVETLLACSIVHPGTEAGLFDYIPLRCRLGQRRLRPDADVVVDRFLITDYESRPEGYGYESLDREALEKHGALLLPQYCSEPLPRLRTTTEANGFTYARLDGDAVGRQSSADLVFGQIYRNAPLLDVVDGKRRWHTNMQIVVPATMVIVDMLIHRSMPKWTYKFAVHWQGPREFFDPTSRMNDLHALPFGERITRIEGAATGAYLRESPRYLEMVGAVTSQFGWRLQDFDVYRLCIEYPLLYTALLLTFEPDEA
jgi:hypothetical protein